MFTVKENDDSLLECTQFSSEFLKNVKLTKWVSCDWFFGLRSKFDDFLINWFPIKKDVYYKCIYNFLGSM